MEVFQHLAGFYSPWCPVWNFGHILCCRIGKNVTDVQYIGYRSLMRSVQTSEFDQAGFMSEIFCVSHVDSVSYFCTPLPHEDSGDNTCHLGLFYHSAKYMSSLLIHDHFSLKKNWFIPVTVECVYSSTPASSPLDFLRSLSLVSSW